jgi:hypothetical protein
VLPRPEGKVDRPLPQVGSGRVPAERPWPTNVQPGGDKAERAAAPPEPASARESGARESGPREVGARENGSAKAGTPANGRSGSTSNWLAAPSSDPYAVEASPASPLPEDPPAAESRLPDPFSDPLIPGLRSGRQTSGPQARD